MQGHQRPETHQAALVDLQQSIANNFSQFDHAFLASRQILRISVAIFQAGPDLFADYTLGQELEANTYC